MKISNVTLSVLRNFGNINAGIHFKKGNVVRTVSSAMNILAQAEIEESFPFDFGIYDLNNFLSVISLHKDDMELEFDDKHVIINGNAGRSTIMYRMCEPSMLVVPPEKNINMPNPEIEFKFTPEDFNFVLKAAGFLSSPNVIIESDGSSLNVVTCDVNNDSAHTDSLRICDSDGKKYRMVLRTENLTKLMSGGYDVSISSKGISRFKSTNMDLTYWVSTEKGSHYTG